jgi:hypothetical protein
LNGVTVLLQLHHFLFRVDTMPFENEIAINNYQLNVLDRILQDLPESCLYQHQPGHGHSPIWLLGHLAICTDFGLSLLGLPGGPHPEWLPLFGPGSQDEFTPRADWNKELFQQAIRSGYQQLQVAMSQAKPELLTVKHQIPFFQGTPIETLGQSLSLLLTNHFGFHLSQLSSCRRSLGLPHLF